MIGINTSPLSSTTHRVLTLRQVGYPLFFRIQLFPPHTAPLLSHWGRYHYWHKSESDPVLHNYSYHRQGLFLAHTIPNNNHSTRNDCLYPQDKAKVEPILIKTFIPAHIKSPAIPYIPYSPSSNDRSMTANEEYSLILRRIRWLQKKNISKYGLLSCKVLTMYVLFLIFASQSNHYILNIRHAVIFSYPKHIAFVPRLFKRGCGKPAEADFLSKIHQ